eukprot:Gregarina_sp_Pseudo_9__60@NODE_103_length_4267_cov_30_934721_g95_i0_p1_GENE_NODE_103_length_4267_cov_30_934721_g95_i0NODE_103_length_4267_cov_30_934721_g95_i0_p1_ORF_typecomplete_len940_score242_14_NODE_103_length_4267_cov_30_934721_g95_i07713590
MQLSPEADNAGCLSPVGALARDKRLLRRLYSYFRFKDGWVWGATCKAFWVYTMFEWQPLELALDADLIYWMRYSSNRAGGRSNVFFSSSPMASFLARICRTLRSLRYEKSYATDDSWRRRVLSPNNVAGTEDIRTGVERMSQPDFIRDSHLSFGDLAVLLLGSCQTLQSLILSVNWDPGAPSTVWLGLPPIRDCEWYILCPKSFPPLKAEHSTARDTRLFDHDNRVPGPQPCRAGAANDWTGALRSMNYHDEHDHLKCCIEIDRSINWTGQALRSPLRIMYGDGKAALSSIANPSTRPTLAFSNLKHLTLQPPDGAIYTRSCWALLCLLRGLKLTCFPQLESLALLGDFVLFRQQKAEHISSLDEWASSVGKSSFQQPFEDTELWVRDMVNLYLCGEIPIRDVPNFSARRFTTFASKWAFVDQQRYWRAILEQRGIWSFPKLKKITLSGTATAGSETWQRLVLINMLPPATRIETLELDRTIRSPVEALNLPYNAEAVNAIRFPELQTVIVRCVYGVETLTVVQRMFSLLLERPIVAQARELVLTDHCRIPVEASRLCAWGTYQTRRLEKSMPLGPRASPSLSRSGEGYSFFVPGERVKLRFRLLFGGEDYDPDEVEDKLMELAPSKSASTASRSFAKERDSRSNMDELDALMDRVMDTRDANDLTYFYDIDEVHFDIGTYAEASKDSELFDIVSDRLMHLRFVNGSYSQRHRGKLAEFIPAVVEEEEPPEEELEEGELAESAGSVHSSVGDSEASELSELPPTEMNSVELIVRPPSLFRAGSNDSQVLGHTGALRASFKHSILDDISDVGPDAREGGHFPKHLFTMQLLTEQRKRLSSTLLFEGNALDHRKLLGVMPYDWPKEEPEPTSESTIKELRVTIRYGMTVLDRDSPEFGDANKEAYRRVMTARKWIAFNPTLKGCPQKTLELKTAPEKSLDQ